jgi:DNA-binding NarL/FixJ family response regulator
MYSIQIIEDDPAYISMMEVILQMEGFTVRSATNGEAGLALLREQRPDLILCDVLMPDMDGHSVLEHLKGDATLADIPFIFVTAMGDRAEVRRGMAAGADDYLPKPFSADELLATVTSRIRRHEALFLKRNKSAFMEEEAILRTKKITRQERLVMQLVGHGATSREIAEHLGISLKTAEVHRANLMNKLGASNAATLARWAVIAEQMEHELE